MHATRLRNPENVNTIKVWRASSRGILCGLSLTLIGGVESFKQRDPMWHSQIMDIEELGNMGKVRVRVPVSVRVMDIEELGNIGKMDSNLKS